MKRTHTTTMTISSITAELINTTKFDGVPRFIPGLTYVEATDGTDTHRWPIRSGDRCFIGDRIEVTVVQEGPDGSWDVHLDPPPHIKPFFLSEGDIIHDVSADTKWIWHDGRWEPLP